MWKRILSIGAISACAAAAQAAPQYSSPVAMPADQTIDSYAIYSQLLPGNVIEWGDVPRSVWLVEDTTQAVPLGRACGASDVLNPHQSIMAPEERRGEFAEVLADFDMRCHNRYLLRSEDFHVSLPLRLLGDEARNRYMRGVSGFVPPSSDIMRAPFTPNDFKGAAGLHSFTAVYFNHAHTLAMTQIGMYCGGLCGNWSWAVLQRTPVGWRLLAWVHTHGIS